MGYFEQKRNRRREGALKTALRLGRMRGAAEVGNTQPFEEWRFVRVSVPAWHWETGVGQGIFRVAGVVQEKMRLDEEQDRQLASTLRWFNKRLPCPDLHSPEAIFWFKFSATECRRRVTQLARQLRSLGVEVVITETNMPGKVVYEDELQVAAIPQTPAGEGDEG